MLKSNLRQHLDFSQVLKVLTHVLTFVNLRRQRYPQRKPSIALNIQGGRSRRRKMKELTNWPGQFHSSFFNAFSDSFGSFRVVSFLYQFSARIFLLFLPPVLYFYRKIFSNIIFYDFTRLFWQIKVCRFCVLCGHLSWFPQPRAPCTSFSRRHYFSAL